MNDYNKKIYQINLFHLLTLWLCFLIYVVKMHDNSNLRREAFMLANGLRMQSIMAGEL